MPLEDLYQEAKEERKGKSKFLTIDENESIEGQFISIEKTEGQFGETYHYTLLVSGEEKILNKKSFRLLEAMKKAKIVEGDNIKITALGEGFKRTYSVKKI